MLQGPDGQWLSNPRKKLFTLFGHYKCLIKQHLRDSEVEIYRFFVNNLAGRGAGLGWLLSGDAGSSKLEIKELMVRSSRMGAGMSFVLVQ